MFSVLSNARKEKDKGTLTTPRKHILGPDPEFHSTRRDTSAMAPQDPQWASLVLLYIKPFKTAYPCNNSTRRLQLDHQECQWRRRPCLLCRCYQSGPAVDKDLAGTVPAGRIDLEGVRIAAAHIVVGRIAAGRIAAGRIVVDRRALVAGGIPSAGQAGSKAAAAGEPHRHRFVDMLIPPGLRPGMWPWEGSEDLRKVAGALRFCRTLYVVGIDRGRVGSCWRGVGLRPAASVYKLIK